MLGRMQINGNSHTLVVRMQNGTTTLAVSYKVKIYTF